jgi:hypothetical protein
MLNEKDLKVGGKYLRWVPSKMQFDRMLSSLIDLWFDFKYHVIDKFFALMGYEPIVPEPSTVGLVVFNELNPKWVTIEKIIVPTEFDKEQLLRAFKYLHDNRTIDTELMAVNAIVHMYQNPGLVFVDSTNRVSF